RCSAADLEREIQKHRMGTLVVQTAAGATVRVEQMRHEFWFGAALANHVFSNRFDPDQASKYKELFLANFNSAVTENALKWHSMEHRRGHVNYDIVDAILAWTEKHDIPLRGHNIFWGVPNFVPKWQKELGDDELYEVVKARALDIGRRFRGRFAEYDLNNEMMHANYYEQRFGPDITKQMADWVRQGDPDAVLYLNDYDVLTGNRLEDFVAHTRNFLKQGVPIGGIGVQGHLHGDSFEPAALRRSLDELAKLKLPIRITEFNMPGQRSRFYRDKQQQLTPEEEQAKARALVEYYTICFAHPAVEGILMWGFWEGANWIPVSSLYRRDWTPTPAAEAYRELVFDTWWTNCEVQADASGRCEVTAFYGTHRVTVGGKTEEVALPKERGNVTVTLR
ncbi:MAG: endo-1,4-beta-xylanase, partial [Pirellulaceae bacterium]